MKRLIAVIVLIPLAIVLVALSVANRIPVVLSLDPFNGQSPAVAVAVPLYVLLYATLAVGVLVGGIATWLSQGRWRRQARHFKRETKVVSRENDRYKAASGTSPATTALAMTRRDAA